MPLKKAQQITHPRRRAVVGTEIIVSIGLIMLLSFLALDAISGYRHSADDYFWRQSALYAADAQLERLRAGAPLDSLPPAELVPERITLTTKREPGAGAWEGFDRVTVIARVTLPTGKVAHEQAVSYLRREGQP